MKYPVDNLDQFKLIQLGSTADDIHIALVELTVASLLRTVGAPYRLNLVTLEREGDFILVLNDIAGERNSEVIPQALLADLHGQSLAVVGAFPVPGTERIIVDSGECIA